MRYSGKLQNPDREPQQREGPNKQAGRQTAQAGGQAEKKEAKVAGGLKGNPGADKQKMGSGKP